MDSVVRVASRDPRVRRTRALLRAALLELAMERDLDSITMSDIAQRAEVNRATVYLHYKDRDDLLLDATENIVAGIVDAVAACRLRPVDTDVGAAAEPAPVRAADTPAPGHLVNLFAHVERHRSLYGRMLGPDGSARFVERLERLLTQAWYDQLLRDAHRDKTEIALQSRFLSGALLGVIAAWTAGAFDKVSGKDSKDGGGLTAEQMADRTWRLIRGGI